MPAEPSHPTTAPWRTRLEHVVDTRSAGLAVWLLRRTRGRLARLWRRRALVLVTRGRRSGRSRAVPLQYFPDGGSMVVVAANSGLDRAPGWYHNLTAEPRAVVDVDGRRVRVRAEELSPAETEAFWPRVLSTAPDYARYPRRTTRRLPLVRLVPDPAELDPARTGGRRPVTVRSSVTVARPAEVVFDYLTDIEREPEWNEALSAVEPLTPGPLAAGSRYRARFAVTGESVIEYVRLDRPDRWETRSTSDLLLVHLTGRITPRPGGACRVELLTELEPRGLLRPARPFLGPRMSSSWEHHLRVVRQRLERQAPGGTP
ncbi:nitroreductase/quinone reductase family protein [Georgenia daeguensis]|uniref:Nitroreductase family deazaflavin-dependent oxidoreductase n=1 Tax=Georgenia daeguensis TaxID=908355 RepID=A0ABP8EWX5_9MICO